MGRRRDSSTSRPLAVAENEEFLRAMRDLRSVPDKDGAAGFDSSGFDSSDKAVSTSRGRRRKQSRRLQKTAVEARLDLHGESVEPALLRLEAFLARCYESGHRRVLVITGKGRRSPGGEGVLRRQVGAWLRRNAAPAAGSGSGIRSPVGSLVEDFASAPNELGGAGAWVLTLRRRR